MENRRNGMKSNYRLTSDHEPTEAQLKRIMREVAQEAKQKATIVNKNLNLEIAKAIRTAMKKKRSENKQ